MAAEPKVRTIPYGSVRSRGHDWAALREHLDQKLGGMRVERYSWWAHWRELADFMLPRRYRWLITPNQANRGSQINGHILDSTATVAARVCASGMMSGITSPSRPWFRLTLPTFDLDQSGPVKLWLDEVQTRMMRVFAESNYYTAKATQLLDLVIFGTAPMIIYEDYDDVIRCFNPCAGEYFAASSARLAVSSLYREFTYTIAQLVEEFGLENCSEGIRAAFKTGGAQLVREVIVCHAIEPNDPRQGGEVVPKRFPFREVYWEWGSSQAQILRARGFHESPFSCPRWDLAANDSYGRSPAMDALGDVKQLQLMTRRQAQGIEKLVNPPLKGPVELKNQPASMLPGGITYIATQGLEGFKPVYEVPPQVTQISELIQQVGARIKETFFNDLFLMISNLDTVRTATEIDARREEKLIQLGPVLERFQSESLDQDIERTFAIMHRAGLIPSAPHGIQGQWFDVEYMSMLAVAQRAAATTAIERLAAFVGNLTAADPAAFDNIDPDEMIDEYADALDVPPKVLRAAAQVAQIRQARQQHAQQQQALQTSMAAVQGAQTLSQTDVGGGQNALQAIMGAVGQRAAA